jgi:hypothetical protein
MCPTLSIFVDYSLKKQGFVKSQAFVKTYVKKSSGGLQSSAQSSSLLPTNSSCSSSSSSSSSWPKLKDKKFKKFKKLFLEQLVLQFSTFSCEALNASLRLLSHLMHGASKQLALNSSLQKTKALKKTKTVRTVGKTVRTVGKTVRTVGKTVRTVGFDLMHSRHLSSLNAVHVQLQNIRYIKSRPRFTVIRSPFVYKKTREQYMRLHRACTVVLPMAKPQQQFFLQLLTASKFPAELSVISHA